MDLDIFKPDMAVGDEVRVRELSKQLDFDKDLLEPGMVVANGNTLTGEMAQGAAINLVTDEEHNPLTPSSQFSFLDKEALEVVRTKGVSSYTSALVGGRGARDELGLGLILNGRVTGKGRLGEPPDRT